VAGPGYGARDRVRNHPRAATAARPVVVIGASLGGLAAAVRLARVGHHVVVLDEKPGPDLGPWLSRPVVALPAAWRDLFRKSGRILDAALAGEGYELVPAPPTRHEFTDGSTLDLPTDRGQQYAAIGQLAGEGAAIAWRDLLDAADETWQLVRRAGLETEADLTEFRTSRFLSDPRTIASEAERLPDERLAALVRSVAHRLGSEPAETPYWLLSRLAVERTFGLWLVMREGVPQPAETLTGLLHRRAADRGVGLRWGVTATGITRDGVATTAGDIEAAAVISAVGHASHSALTGRTVEIALPRRLGPLRLGTRRIPADPPASTIEVGPADDGPVEVVRHGTDGVSVTWTLPGRTVTATGAPSSSGLRWHGPATIAAFHPLAGNSCVYAGSGTLGGAEPWAQLLVGALATYRIHFSLTGDDIRPSNKAYRP
jgi:glycine/D-amino acid oxidase-like deaminating enzyme